jgi:hypothetical protein
MEPRGLKFHSRLRHAKTHAEQQKNARREAGHFSFGAA